MLKSKPWKEVKVGDVISRYEGLFLPNKVVSIELTPSGKSVRVTFDNNTKVTERINTKIFYKGDK